MRAISIDLQEKTTNPKDTFEDSFFEGADKMKIPGKNGESIVLGFDQELGNLTITTEKNRSSDGIRIISPYKDDNTAPSNTILNVGVIDSEAQRSIEQISKNVKDVLALTTILDTERENVLKKLETALELSGVKHFDPENPLY